jgi:hypothetical protein
VTGPATGDPARGTSAPPRSAGTRDAIPARDATGALLALIAAGLALRVIIAYLLPGSGFEVDLNAFKFWAADLAEHGPWGFYERPFFHDYTPGYLYILWGLGYLGQALGGLGDLIKAPAIVADLVLAWLVAGMVRELGGSQRRALGAAALVLFVPITWFDSVVWGQVDSVGVVFLLLGLRALWRNQPERAAFWAVVAAVTKPQLGILVPLVAAVVIARALRDEAGGGDVTAVGDGGPPAGRLAAVRGWFARERGPVRILSTGVTGFLTAVALAAPFKLTILGLFGQVAEAAGGYPWLTVNAYNPWALLAQNGNGLAANGAWVCDSIADTKCDVPFLIGPLWAVFVGTALLMAVVAAVSVVVARRPTRTAMLVGLAVLAIAFFVVPTRVHERYLFPFFALGAILAVLSRRWLVAFTVLAAANFANLYVVPTTLYPGSPSIRDWLGIGPAIRSPFWVGVIAIAHLAVFLWAAVQLRRSGQEDVAVAELTPGAARLPTFPARAEVEPAVGVGPPDEEPEPQRGGRTGPWAAIRRRLLERPLRPDRSRGLHGEPGGRLDRLDAWVFVVLVVAALGTRTFRLAEPYQMHFDEVYHARTATEFLQSWRYGEPHAIYEYTHPHLAKYAIAAGIVLFADDRVTAVSDLGVPVRDAAIEGRRDDPTLPGSRAGDRLYVATGTAVRAYDLGSRALVAEIDWAGAAAVAVDATSHRVFVASDDGAVGVMDASRALDPLRGGPTAASAAIPARFERLVDLGAPVERLLATGDGTAVLAGTAAGEVVALEPATGEVLGRATVSGLADLAPAGTSDVLVARPADVADRSAAASVLASILGGTAEGYEARLASSAEEVSVPANLDADPRAALDAAIADGRLAGFEFRSESLIAAAGSDGLTFLTRDATAAGFIATEAPVTGLDLVTGVDEPSVYAATGEVVTVVRVGGEAARTGPAYSATIWMPAEVFRVAFDPATEVVHVLGLTPDGDASTVYAIEPHGNAVFADTRLPFGPAAWAVDAAPQYPSADREELLAFSADGAVAAASIGGYAFAWRLPGVAAGALMAGLLYLLARTLFRRRAVGLFAGTFAVADGMLFAQSRIAMNDSFVGLFLVAAYLLFAALWTGALRGRWAFWIAMPVIGVLLGLGLAAKWVAVYAIGGLFVLVLVRSALGRLLVVGGLLLGTTGLGYLAISVPSGATSGGNYTFLLIMIGLTFAAVLAAVLRPIAWTADEVRFAIGAPVAAGLAVFLGAAALAPPDPTVALGGLALTPGAVALALVGAGALASALFWLAGRWGFGPLAPPPEPDDPAALLPPPSPPGPDWARPGWLGGIPFAWILGSLLIVPLVVYVISYLPWVALGNRLTETWPAGNSGQTLIDLTASMYDYHDRLRASHAASSPWWAWPFDLKPVWFYNGGFAGGTAAAIYDVGNLVVWWLGIPAVAFAAWQAFRRRSLALTIVAVGFAVQWLAWSRIDRATFQYHYYTALPFLILALGYFAAELWHGASSRTWLLARIAAALAVVAPGLMWLLRAPLCAYVGVERARAGSEVCVGNASANIPAANLFAALRDLPPEVVAIGLLVPLAAVAWFVLTARDARRFVGGLVIAAVAWFVVWYPNLAALPLPSNVFNAYQGVLPTYVWAFQFPVNLDPSAAPPSLLAAEPAILLGALVVTCLILAYSAWIWRIALAEREAGESGAAGDYLPTGDA